MTHETEQPAFVITYQGQAVPFYELPGQGYRFLCPGKCCTAWHWIETASGSRHKLTSLPGAPVTIVGSLGCNCTSKGPKCTWHVMITEGVAKDA